MRLDVTARDKGKGGPDKGHTTSFSPSKVAHYFPSFRSYLGMEYEQPWNMGKILLEKSVPRQSVQAAWWTWEPVFRTRWKQLEHINMLELRAVLLSAKHQILHLRQVYCHIFHLVDSFCEYVKSGKRLQWKNG